ncbi:hypothetical protein NDU88_003317 [Pleurodeles waltl]|uniref:Uncharacterized protein n=1 Tax=Pleurodeles waltl TaxID=8319 RepID=A0AAV7NIW7_PLEWA|nr:hypothetical protein NDU88_003317 [Pleurodeles waltl]
MNRATHFQRGFPRWDPKTITETFIQGRGLAVEENGRLRKDLRAPGRSSWQTEGLPPAILTPSVASRLAEGGGLRRGKVVGPERRQTRPETREQMRPPCFRGAAD